MSAARTRHEGFTLLEILVVVFLIALLSSALAIGNVGALSDHIGDTSAEMEATLRYASERAASTGRAHSFTVDLELQRYRLEQEVELPPEGEPTRDDLLRPPRPRRGLEPVPTLQGRWSLLKQDKVLIEFVEIGSERYQAETVRIGFGGDGSADAAALQLLAPNGARRILAVQPFTGEVQVLEGSADNG
jgi:prepilin-type N-terminal cleavage/methylation domain-containing protein